MHNLDQGAHGWHKSSYSGNEAECVETGLFPAGSLRTVAVRDTKAGGTGPVLGFTAEDWTAFIAELKTSDRFTGGTL
ncbi:DUF397 domain-containing protein [Streptomyces sp. NRRL WC-3742]|uniref:DUF397 domain-containing protein n=1 Tax=Streptomyces sp. NRRL WC-3742 TaxID=1463934 RepID=UPI0004C96A7B|nr:DUF397 domain-containing protein [Streptomyces sp. NRRL WC-3742]